MEETAAEAEPEPVTTTSGRWYADAAAAAAAAEAVPEEVPTTSGN